jgi:hypothetical protein
MLRVAGWTVGLFGAGAAISRSFSSPWAEPVVLLALGVAFLFVSRRSARTSSVVERLSGRAAPGPQPAPAGAPIPVEQSA